MLSKENSRTIKVELLLKITDEDLCDIVCTAIEGGIGYWARLDNTREEWLEFEKEEFKDLTVDEIATRILLNGKSLYLIDREDKNTVFELNLTKLLYGIQETIANDSSLLEDGELDTCNVDGEVADTIIQYAIFGELVYG